MDGMRHLAVCVSSWLAAQAAGQRGSVQISADMGSVRTHMAITAAVQLFSRAAVTLFYAGAREENKNMPPCINTVQRDGENMEDYYA